MVSNDRNVYRYVAKDRIILFPYKLCVPLIRRVDRDCDVTDLCFGCTRCAQFCPSNSIPMNPYHHHEIEEPTCTRCDICRQVCPVNAIEIINLAAKPAPAAGQPAPVTA